MIMKKRNILELLSLSHSFIQGKKEISVLENINLSVGIGEIVSLEGPSGIGKSTLLQIAGLLETPTKGDVVIDAISCKNIADIKKSSIRGKKIGFIYQFHHLLSEFSALENIAFPRLINGEKKALAFERANELLNKMGLAHRINNRPAELSGGEQQRVAIARAIINEPKILLADEPTGNLDQKTADIVFDEILDIITKNGISALIATHNPDLAKRMDTRLSLSAGGILKK